MASMRSTIVTDVGRDDEGRQAARPLAFAGPCKGQIEVGDAAVGDVGLLADQHPFVAVAHRRCRHVRGVRTALRFGHGEGGDSLPACHARQPLALLLDRAEQGDGARAEPLHREGEIGEPMMASEDFAADGEAADIGTVFAIGHGELQETRPGQAPAQATGRLRPGPTPPRREWSRHTIAPARRQACDGAARRTARRASQSPWNSGLLLSAKAS